jgi:hypothetical protein
MRAIKYCAPVLILAAATCVTAAPNILLSNIPAESPGYYPAALASLGYTFTEISNVPDFYAALTNGTEWDLVLVDNYDGIFDDTTLVSLMNYIGKGGRCVLSYWGMNWSLASILGANMPLSGYSYTTPIPVLRWEPTDPLLTTPNAIPDLAPVEEPGPWTVDGFYLQPQDDATAVAGYTPAAADYQAAIVVGNEGRTILLGITPELFGPEMEKLLENCIEYVLAPAPTPPLSLTLSSLTPAVGSAFTVDVTVQPLTQKFDAWGCIFGPGPSAYSFTLGNPTRLRSGTDPLVRNVPGLSAPYATRLLDLTIPSGVAGEYTVVVELCPSGLDPLIPIDGYLSMQTVTVH